MGRPVEAHRERLERYREIRRCNEALQKWVEGARGRLDRERSAMLAGVHRNLIARNREYSLVLHSQDRLRAAMARAVGGLGGL